MKKNCFYFVAALMMLGSAGVVSCHHHDDHDHSAEDHDHGTEHVESEHVHEEEAADEHGHDGLIVLSEAQAKAAGVLVQEIKAGTFRSVYPASGAVLPALGTEETVVATTSGRVELFDGLLEGKSVQKGQVLAWVSARELQDGSPLEKAKAEYETAQKELERAEKLATGKIVSDKELQEARLRFQTANAAYEGLKGKEDRKGVRVLSPMAGYIKQRLVSPGDYVTVGQPIAIVTQDRRLQLRVEVSERYADRLSLVQSANFRVGSQANVICLDSIHGRVLSKGRSVVPGAFFIPIVFEFDNVGSLIPGSFAEVWLLGAPREGVLTVPVSALTEEQGVYYVYVQKEKEHYVKTEVQLGDRDGLNAEIVHGLHEGDRVVTVGAVYVKLAANAGAIPEGHNHNH